VDSAPTLRLGPRALAVSLRPYDAKDEDAAVSLWLRSWQTAYPQIDFAQRLDWWRERWRNELTKSADIVIAEAGDETIGFVIVDPQARYLDQLVVAPEHWG
jgi:putative acetyltransferase